MGIGYMRNKTVVKKECGKCHTVWDDAQIVEDGLATSHGYGYDSCPFCHSEWNLDLIQKFPKLKLKNYRDN